MLNARYLRTLILIMSKLVYITRRERFSAAHKLSREEWSEEKNEAVFGKCANPNWHGHNYQLFVTVKSEVSPETGFVMDLKILGEIIKDKIITHTDHKNLNLDTGFMKGIMTSTENICIAIWDELEPNIASNGATLHCVKLQETENNYVEYYG
jgi:6-pyruvoyltetrahydropterin/6-carboxytetrahydropterin synthase